MQSPIEMKFKDDIDNKGKINSVEEMNSRALKYKDTAHG